MISFFKLAFAIFLIRLFDFIMISMFGNYLRYELICSIAGLLSLNLSSSFRFLTKIPCIMAIGGSYRTAILLFNS
jgi:transketolase C-terminal domain/subunit